MTEKTKSFRPTDARRLWRIGLIAVALLVIAVIAHFYLTAPARERKQAELTLLKLRELKARVTLQHARIRRKARTVMPDLVTASLSEIAGDEVDNPALRKDAAAVARYCFYATNQIACLEIPERLPDRATQNQHERYEAWSRELHEAKEEAVGILDDKGGVVNEKEVLDWGVFSHSDREYSSKARVDIIKAWHEKLMRKQQAAAAETNAECERVIKKHYAEHATLEGFDWRSAPIKDYEKTMDEIRFANVPPVVAEWKDPVAYREYVSALEKLVDYLVVLCEENDPFEDMEKILF